MSAAELYQEEMGRKEIKGKRGGGGVGIGVERGVTQAVTTSHSSPQTPVHLRTPLVSKLMN